MKVVQGSLGILGSFTVCAFAACQVHASTWSVSFDPDAPVSTNGWNFGATTTNKTNSGTQPGGRKFNPDKGATQSIESPLYTANIRVLALSAWGNTLNPTSRVDVWGRADGSSAYAILFSRDNLSNKLAENEPLDRIVVPEDRVCRQVRIDYTKSSGTWTLAKLTVTDDAIRAETPTNLRTEVADVEARRVCVRWDLAEGLSESEWRTFTTATVGGIGDSETVWRETFDGVPAVTATRSLDASALAALGFGDWDAVNVRQTKGIPGSLQIGADKGVAGSLTTPPLGIGLEAGHALVVRAAARDVASGVMPISVVAGGVTSCVAEVSISKTPQDCLVTLPALGVADRILVHSLTNYASRATLVHDLAVCAPGGYRAETVVTNACFDVTSVVGDAAEVTVPADGTNLWLEVRTVYGGEASPWTEPFPVTLPDTDADESGGAGEGDEASALAAPSRIRAGRLPDGRIRVGWSVPDGATNVKVRVWSLSPASGGLAAVATDDILWRETFAKAPATNSTVNVNSSDRFDLYTDGGAIGWDDARSVSVSLATEAGALKIGTSDKVGALVSNGLNVSGEGLALVVTAKRGTGEKNSGVTLRAALLSADAVRTNALGQSATLAADWTEYAFPVPVALAGGESLLVESVIGTPKDGRAVLDDIALVRGYAAATVVTNVQLSADCGVSESLDLPADGAVRYVSLAAQGADGLAGDWSEPLALDPSALGDWKDRLFVLKKADSSAVFTPEDLPDAGDRWDVSESPFRFFLDGDEQFELANRDANVPLKVGVYVCTNVFGRNWAVLVPGSPGSGSEVRDAECRLTVRTGTFAVRRLELSGTFAQLNATNVQEKALALQYRAIASDGTAGEWLTAGEFKSSCMAADVSPDLVGTQTNLMCAADVRVPRGATVEARVWCRKAYRSGNEAPLGFRDFRVRVISSDERLVFVIR